MVRAEQEAWLHTVRADFPTYRAFQGHGRSSPARDGSGPASSAQRLEGLPALMISASRDAPGCPMHRTWTGTERDVGFPLPGLRQSRYGCPGLTTHTDHLCCKPLPIHHFRELSPGSPGSPQGERVKTYPTYHGVGKVVKMACVFPAFLGVRRGDPEFRGKPPRPERGLAVTFLKGAALYACSKPRKSGRQKNATVSILHCG